MRSKTWILVANASEARILEAEKSDLRQIEVLKHPETRLHGRDLVTDKPGREFSSVGSRHSAIEPHVDPQKNEAQHFALQISQHLDHAFRSNHFKKLYVIASPAFLGLLRHSLHSATQDSIVLSIDKDLTDKSPVELRSYLPKVL